MILLNNETKEITMLVKEPEALSRKYFADRILDITSKLQKIIRIF